MRKEELVLCAWHTPKDTIVNRKTGEPLVEALRRILPEQEIQHTMARLHAEMDSHGMCDHCRRTQFPQIPMHDSDLPPC